ncbi:MAG: 50S ribosomal protein L29 [Geovibrio sp.]|uniref:50S ribosomal protein L29 n=1 Tax=Geovibrio ferrireducens TaxID=46201 RepID=UPI0022478A46|nr:50S ribosomal protein L29 [Geovibrio ferrireducens]MCD8493478.1 50S ribosomal protein L29 [Geovibrio sp.]MCD8569080.1 50S ribosomal protein L29 [Geovibrio sp.]
MSEFKDMNVKDLVEKEKQLREDVFRTRFKLATGDLEDTSSIRKMKKDIARIKTVLSQRMAESAEQ